MTRCGAPRVAATLPSRPGQYHQRTRTTNGRASTRILTDGQFAGHGPGSTTAKGLPELAAGFKILSFAVAVNDPRWNRCG
jgi:hypothetical protein